MEKFWQWKNKKVMNQESQEEVLERTLFLNGTIAEESWFDDDVTPQLLRKNCFPAVEILPFGLIVLEETA